MRMRIFREYKDETISKCSSKGVVYKKRIALRELIKGVTIQDHAWTKLYKKSLWEHIEYPVGKFMRIYEQHIECFKKQVLFVYYRKYVPL